MKTSKINKKNLIILPIILVMVVLVLSVVGDILSEKKMNTSAGQNGESGGTDIDWESVNEAIEKYDFEAKGYWLGSEYKEEQEEFNCVSVTNYDDSKAGAFKEVEYQLLITYGECAKLSDDSSCYEEPVIEIWLFDNQSSEHYIAIYSEEGVFMEEDGKWFPDNEKETFLNEVVYEAQSMFGLGGNR